MSWFKTDDRLHAHRKTRKLTRSHPTKTRDAAPFGLWVLAGSWAGQNATDGWVPESELDRWDDDWPEMARRLIDAGFWWPEERNGERGYGFVNWEEYNPSASQPTDSGRFGAHVRWHIKRKVVVSDCPHCPTEPDPISVPDDTPDSTLLAPYMGADGGPTWEPIALPDPTRPVPDPTPPVLGAAKVEASSTELAPMDSPTATAVEPKAKRATRIPEDWSPAREQANLDTEAGFTADQLRRHLANFRDYWTAKAGKDATKMNWDSTWRYWLRNQAGYEKRTATNRPRTAASISPDEWAQWAADAATKENAS